MNQVATTGLPKTTSVPANGADEPPPHPGFEGAAQTRVPATRVFEDAPRSQATQVEQARAIAEVQAAVLVAQKCPRDINRALGEMRQVCKIERMAERAFFAFPRGGEKVNGASIHLARELARIWGNVTYGVKELARNDAKGESEMLAYAWDLQTNVRPDTGFIVPHVRDTKSGRKPITDVRDIYENNANMGARRVRECIFAALPRWFTDEAEDLCRQTLEEGGGVPVEKRIPQMLAAFQTYGVSKEMIEKRVGCAVGNMSPAQWADLKIVSRSIKNGEISKDEAFPETPAADVTKALQAKAEKAEPKTEPTPAAAAPTSPAQAAAAAKAPDHSATVAVILEKIEKIGTGKGLDNLVNVTFAEDIDLLRTDAPEVHAQVTEAIAAKRKWLAR
jgi:hypothetical protein